MEAAPLSIPQLYTEIPSFLSVAYSVKFKNAEKAENFFKRIFQVISRFFQLLKELDTSERELEAKLDLHFANFKKLLVDFTRINNGLNASNRSICAYIISPNDHTGAMLGNTAYYFHHYNIQRYQNHFDVAAKVLCSTKQIFDYLGQLKTKYPNREIKVVHICAHGNSDGISFNLDHSIYKVGDIQENEFAACAKNASIILSSCLTGAGTTSIAENIAKNNRGKTVLAPDYSSAFPKPLFVKKGNVFTVDHVASIKAPDSSSVFKKIKSSVFFQLFNISVFKKFKYEIT